MEIMSTRSAVLRDEDVGFPGETSMDTVPTYRKYTIGIEEAAQYYGIGTKELCQIIADHPGEDFFLEIGRQVLIKRRQFEVFLDSASAL